MKLACRIVLTVAGALLIIRLLQVISENIYAKRNKYLSADEN